MLPRPIRSGSSSGLFSRSLGRVAQAYEMVSRLPERQQRFVLGSWRADARDRQRGQAELERVLERLPQPASVFANPGAGPLADVDAAARRAPGQAICGVPADEAIALTWDMGNPGGLMTQNFAPDTGGFPFFACGPLQCSGAGRTNELFRSRRRRCRCRAARIPLRVPSAGKDAVSSPCCCSSGGVVP